MNDRDRINRVLECANEEQLYIIRRFVERYVVGNCETSSQS